jgi:hypothetical protein
VCVNAKREELIVLEMKRQGNACGGEFPLWDLQAEDYGK